MSASIPPPPPPPACPRLIDHPTGLLVRRPNRLATSSSDLTTTMAAASVLTPPQTVRPALPRPSRLWPRATLPPALLAEAAATETPPLRCDEPAAAVNVRGTKKRGPPLPPPSGKCAKKPRTAPASSSGAVAAVTVNAERRVAVEKKVAGCILARSWAGAAAAWRQAEARTALQCLCLELPRGSRCALHQDAPGRSWMEQRRSGFPLVGGDGEVLVPMVGAGHDAEVFSKYSRWRKNVRMPSRFYMQHVRVIDDGQED